MAMPQEGCRILVVEDDDAPRTALVHLLTLMGFTVCTASTLAEAQEQLDGQDCLILDVNLPDGRGTAILRRVRSERRPIRVAVYTGSDDPRQIEEIRQLGPDALFKKPVSPDQLFEWLLDVKNPTPQPTDERQDG